MTNARSFSSADVDIPAKLLKNKHFCTKAIDGVVRPVHLQWIPTNRCNANCDFCSCHGRDKTLEMDFELAKNAIEKFANLGTRAVTITGGGEPTLYKHFYPLLEVFRNNNIEVGLVTNGLNCEQIAYDRMTHLRWVRISIHDNYDMNVAKHAVYYYKSICGAVDVALSYVITKADEGAMKSALDIANKQQVSHIRFVQDIVGGQGKEVDFDSIFEGMDTSRAIFQTRKNYNCGTERCIISVAKPVISADGYIYPCCGTQYADASAEATGDMLPKYRMGTLKDIDEIWRHQSYFDGSGCDKCYYSNYNSILQTMVDDVKHVEFI